MAERERAEARVHEERAQAHEQGLNDDELMHDESRSGNGREQVVGAHADGGRPVGTGQSDEDR